MSITCPEKNQLKSFSQGLLGGEDSDRLMLHLQDCEDCQVNLETIDCSGGEDTFIHKLREAAPGNNDPHIAEVEFRAATAKALAALATMDEFATDVALPKSIGEYEIVKPIGRGGMGRVFLGRHTKLGRKVAIKVLAPHRRWDQRMHDRFEAEMRAIGGLNHPNIVVAHDARDVDGVAVLVTEYVEGLDGSELLKRKGRLSIEDACRIGEEVCKALGYVSEKGLVHRDVKPSNIMIDDDGNVKLLDLGLARFESAEGEPDFTATGQAMGTADYVAPEQINDARNVDGRTDLYGLGCTLYKMIAGRAPFATDEYPTPFAKMNAHVSQTPTQLSQLRDGVPKQLETLVHGLLAKEPASRPKPGIILDQLEQHASASDLAEMVRVAKTMPLAEHRFESQTAASLKPQSEQHPKGFMAGGIPWWAALVSVLAAFAGGMLMQINLTVEKPDGTKSNVVIPDGSTAVIDAEGNVTVKLPKGETAGSISAKNVSTISDNPEIDAAAKLNNDVYRKYGTEGETAAIPIKGDSGVLEKDDLFDIVTEPCFLQGEFMHSRRLASELKFKGLGTEGTTGKHFTLVRPGRHLAARLEEANRLGLKFHCVPHSSERVLKNGRYQLQGVWSGRLPNDVPFAVAFAHNRIVLFGPGGYQKAAKFDVELSGKPGKTRLLRVYGSEKNNALSKELDRGEFWFEDSGKLRPDKLYAASVSLRGIITEMSRVMVARSDVELNALGFLKSLENMPVRLSAHLSHADDANPLRDRNLSNLKYDPKPVVTNWDFVSARVIDSGKQPSLAVSLSEVAGDKLRFVTKSNVGSRLVLKLDGKVVMAPKIADVIGRELMLTGDFTKKQLHDLANDLVPMSRMDFQAESENNLLALQLAILNYESANMRFPMVQERGFSWRVSVLPFFGHNDLYKQFNFEEPWNSKHNLAVAKKMPDVYRLPGDLKDSFHTHYLAATGAGTAFEAGKEIGFGQVTDGSSNTIFILQDQHRVVWTKPEDFEVNEGSVKQLLSRDDPKFMFVKGDGSTAIVNRDRLDEWSLMNLLRRNDGNVVENALYVSPENPFRKPVGNYVDAEAPGPGTPNGIIQEGVPMKIPMELRNSAPLENQIDIPLQDFRR